MGGVTCHNNAVLTFQMESNWFCAGLSLQMVFFLFFPPSSVKRNSMMVSMGSLIVVIDAVCDWDPKLEVDSSRVKMGLIWCGCVGCWFQITAVTD